MLEIPWRRAVARCGLRGSDGIQGAANFCGAGGLTAAFRAGDGLADIFSSPRCHNAVQMMPAHVHLELAKNPSRSQFSYAPLLRAYYDRLRAVTETPD